MHSRPCPSTLLSASILPILLLLAGCGQRGGVLAPDRISPGTHPDARAGVLVSARGGDPNAAPRQGIYRRIWPHEDGHSWAYRYVSRNWNAGGPEFHPTPDASPSTLLDEAARFLESQPIGPNPTTSLGAYGLRFNGQVTTRSGVTAQNLDQSLIEGAGAISVASAPADGFLQLLARARPDLATKLAARGLAPMSVMGAASLSRPTLLHGYAWEQNDDWIGTYGDLNQQVAWIFLTSDLRAGSEFTLQLVPDLADDVFLHARMLEPRRVSTDAGVFQHAFEVLYLVDFGVSTATDANGNPLGSLQAYLLGTIDFAPGVGPVRSYERTSYSVVSGGGFQPVDGDITLSLTGTDTPGATLAVR